MITEDLIRHFGPYSLFLKWNIRSLTRYQNKQINYYCKNESLHCRVWSTSRKRATHWNVHIIFAKMILNSPSRVSCFIACLILSERCKLIDYDTLHKKLIEKKSISSLCVKKYLPLRSIILYLSGKLVPVYVTLSV